MKQACKTEGMLPGQLRKTPASHLLELSRNIRVSHFIPKFTGMERAFHNSESLRVSLPGFQISPIVAYLKQDR